jgi:hypothetical protein
VADKRLTFDGAEYTLPEAGTDQLYGLVPWLENRALERIERTQGECSDVVYQKRFEAVTRIVAGGHFGLGSDGFSEAFEMPETQCRLFYLCLSSKHPEVTEEQAGRWWEQMQLAAFAERNAAKDMPETTEGEV